MTIHVELVSPERILYSDDAEMVICRTIGGGEIAFLAGHTPFLGALATAPVRIKTSEREKKRSKQEQIHQQDDVPKRLRATHGRGEHGNDECCE